MKFLRKEKGFKQDEMKAGTDVAGATWSDYERGKTEPDFNTLFRIASHFEVTIDDLLSVDIEIKRANVHLIEKAGNQKNSEIVHPKVHPTVHLTDKKEYKTEDFKLTVTMEPEVDYITKNTVIPITDISVAAGSGAFNSDFIEKVDSIRLPAALLKVSKTYLCVKIKGLSMSPTLQDGGYAIIRLLDKQEWAKMHDERIYVVSTNEGMSYLKRVKNRFKQGFIVLRSDNPDQASYGPFNLEANEINTIWYVEWYFSAKMPNIHDQYYTRLQRLEDRLDLMEEQSKRINPK